MSFASHLCVMAFFLFEDTVDAMNGQALDTDTATLALCVVTCSIITIARRE